MYPQENQKDMLNCENDMYCAIGDTNGQPPNGRIERSETTGNAQQCTYSRGLPRRRIDDGGVPVIDDAANVLRQTPARDVGKRFDHPRVHQRQQRLHVDPRGHEEPWAPHATSARHSHV